MKVLNGIVCGLLTLGGWSAPVGAQEEKPRLLPEPVAVTVEQRCPEVRDRLADLLFSDDITDIEVVAVTYEEATATIHAAVDGYLAATDLGCDDALRFGSEILKGLDEHTVRSTTRALGGYHMVVTGPAEAEKLGETLAVASGILARTCDGSAAAPPLREAAQNLFSSFVYDSESGVPMVHQYLEQARKVAEMPFDRQMRYVQ